MELFADRLWALRDDEGAALLFEDERWTYRELIQLSIARANLLLDLRPPGPFHVGLLLDNVPEFCFLLGGAAFAGATVVGINPTRRGAELERDLHHTSVGILITEEKYLPLVEGLDHGVDPERFFVIESPRWRDAVETRADSARPDVALDAQAPYLLIFTSGTTGQPKAAICSQGRLAGMCAIAAQIRGLTSDDVSYQAMPMFHSNAIFAGWAPSIAVGAATALRRKFSASGFLPDVRKFGATQCNYVGKPLTYVLATPEQPDDADNPLELAFGNEGAVHDLKRFEQRFGCRVFESYGSTEGGVSISRDQETPASALGQPTPGVVVLNPETGEECPVARFDSSGKLINGDEAIGELANREGALLFEGYWNNEDANRERTHDGIYWTGDLAYRDEKGFIYFAGRGFDWLRVDGENFAAAPVERILTRHEDVSLAAVYAVPDAEIGDQVMAALIVESGRAFDPAGFAKFLQAQPDMGTKWLPRYVRVATALPQTETNKILKRVLRQERWECEDPVWLREDAAYRRLTPDDVARIRQQFEARGRASLLDA
jgi:fatty-acyl-CoA synthase